MDLRKRAGSLPGTFQIIYLSATLGRGEAANCSRGFARRDHLLEHERKHTGQKPSAWFRVREKVKIHSDPCRTSNCDCDLSCRSSRRFGLSRHRKTSGRKLQSTVPWQLTSPILADGLPWRLQQALGGFSRSLQDFLGDFGSLETSGLPWRLQQVLGDFRTVLGRLGSLETSAGPCSTFLENSGSLYCRTSLQTSDPWRLQQVLGDFGSLQDFLGDFRSLQDFLGDFRSLQDFLGDFSRSLQRLLWRLQQVLALGDFGKCQRLSTHGSVALNYKPFPVANTNAKSILPTVIITVFMS